MKPSEFIKKELEGKEITKLYFKFEKKLGGIEKDCWESTLGHRKWCCEEFTEFVLKQVLSKLNSKYISVEEHEKLKTFYYDEIRKLSKFETDRIKKLKEQYEKEIKDIENHYLQDRVNLKKIIIKKQKEIKELTTIKHAYNILNREHTQMEQQLSKSIEIEEVEKIFTKDV